MTLAKPNLWLALLFLALLSACGYPGVPLPPSLELARPVTNLRATRKGNTVTLTWTPPTQTTDGHNIRHAGPIAICRSMSILQQCGTPIAKLPPPKIRGGAGEALPGEQTYTDTLSNPSGGPDAKLMYAVEVLNSYGRSAGLSNQVEVPAVPALPAPGDVHAQLGGDGVHLSWSVASSVPEANAMSFVYRIYRRESGTNNQVVAGEVPLQAGIAPSFLDGNIEWEKTYEYCVTAVTVIAPAQGASQQVEGDDSPAVTVVAHDVFPPGVPSGLQAVFSGPGQKPFIDLVWAPDTDGDLAGYNVYRSETGSEAKKLNADPTKSPAFRDNAVIPGHEYTYSVSAVDIRGNESARSEPASEKVPEQ